MSQEQRARHSANLGSPTLSGAVSSQLAGLDQQDLPLELSEHELRGIRGGSASIKSNSNTIKR
jgi:hypothetical protein